MSAAGVVPAHWLEVVGELLERPPGRLPHEVLSHELADTFDVVTVSWNWREPSGAAGYRLTPAVAGWSEERMLRQLHEEPELLDRHPLVTWFAVTGASAPQTVARVPLEVSPAVDRERVAAYLRGVDCEQQLSLPYVLAGLEHRAFVLCRGGMDFTDDELALAGLVQRLVRGLHRQVRVLSAVDPRVAGTAATVPLTGRETAVLGLAVTGLTAEAIARRLGISPRTVDKHLEHVYRKLGVRDRLSASRLAAALGLDRAGTDAPGT